MATLTAHFGSDGLAYSLHKSGIPCGGHTYAGGKHRSSDGHVAVGRLLGKKHRYAKPCILYNIFL